MATPPAKRSDPSGDKTKHFVTRQHWRVYITYIISVYWYECTCLIHNSFTVLHPYDLIWPKYLLIFLSLFHRQHLTSSPISRNRSYKSIIWQDDWPWDYGQASHVPGLLCLVLLERDQEFSPTQGQSDELMNPHAFPRKAESKAKSCCAGQFRNLSLPEGCIVIKTWRSPGVETWDWDQSGRQNHHKKKTFLHWGTPQKKKLKLHVKGRQRTTLWKRHDKEVSWTVRFSQVSSNPSFCLLKSPESTDWEEMKEQQTRFWTVLEKILKTGSRRTSEN